MVALVDTVLDRVVVHPGAAQVTRTGAVEVRARASVKLAGLPAGLDDDSVQISMTGPGRAVDLRVVVEAVTADSATTAPYAEVLAARRVADALEAERTAVRAALDALAGLAPVAPEERDGARPAWADVVAARLALVELARDRAAALRAELADLDRRANDAYQALAAVEERHARRSNAELPAGAITKAVVITVEPDGGGGACTLRCDYRVDGARWAPAYVARLDDGGVRFELRAAIAQATGEDWHQVAIELSTARPGRRVELPELAAIKIGRAQPRPPRAGWRPPPVGVDELYRDYDQAFGHLPSTPSALPPTTSGAPMAPPAPPEGKKGKRQRVREEAEVGGAPLAEQASFAPPPQSFAVAVGRAAASQPSAPPPAKVMMMSLGGGGAPPRGAPGAPSASRRTQAGLIGDDEAPEDDGPIAARAELLAFARLVLPGPRQSGRGALRRADEPGAPLAERARHAADLRARALGGLALPAGIRLPQPGVYDYAFAADGRLDVPSDGAWHSVAILARAAPVAIAHVATPAVAPEVYRVATLTNPLDAPLLPGPVDVYERGELVITATVDETPPGGAVAIGLGVDPTVKTARNARYREEVAGVLRGSLRLAHDVTVDVENLGGRAIQLEVRERVPIPAPDVDEVEVAIDRVTPMWEAWRPEPRPGEPALRGGHRWQVAVGPGEKKALRVEYAIKIASKHELVGGNRREP